MIDLLRSALTFFDAHPITSFVGFGLLICFGAVLLVAMFTPSGHPCDHCEGENGDKMTCRNGCMAYQSWDVETREWM